MSSKGPNLTYSRGDTGPVQLAVTVDDAAYDFTGWTDFKLTIDPREEPEDATQNVDTMVGGFASDGSDGRLEFLPSGASENDKRTNSEAWVPGEYFYDVQAIDPNGRRRTVFRAGGRFTILQDVTKD